MSKHLEKMCLETEFQPIWLRNDRDIERATWRAKEQLGLPVTVKYFGNLTLFTSNNLLIGSLCHIGPNRRASTYLTYL